MTGGEVTGRMLLGMLRAVAGGCVFVWLVLDFERVAGWMESFAEWVKSWP